MIRIQSLKRKMGWTKKFLGGGHSEHSGGQCPFASHPPNTPPERLAGWLNKWFRGLVCCFCAELVVGVKDNIYSIMATQLQGLSLRVLHR